MRADKEKRRAISREAAKRRRRVESDVFAHLAQLLPVKPSVRVNLDKPSIIRLTLSYIRMRKLLRVAKRKEREAETSHTVSPYGAVQLERGDERHRRCADVDKKPEEVEILGETNLYLSVLEGFLMVLTAQGDMIYLSDNVCKYMGLTQTELMGHNIFDFIHPCDHEEIKIHLRLMPEESWLGAKREFVIRIKGALTNRGRNGNPKSDTWKVLHCWGQRSGCASSCSVSCLLLTCQPLPLSHTLLGAHTFSSRHSMDMRFTYSDHRVTLLLGYSPEELLGRSIYDLCHTLDVHCLTQNHRNLCWKSQSVSRQYRMLVRGGGYVWVESHSAVIPIVRPSARARHTTSQQPLSILSITYILSGVEEPTLQFSLGQTESRFSV